MEVFDNVRSQCAVFKKVVQSFEQSGWFVLSAPNSYQITSFYSQMTGLFYKVRRPGEKHKAMEAISIALQPFEAEKGRMNGPYFGGEFLPTWPHDFDLVSSASLAFCHYFRRFSLSPRFSHLAMVRANGVHEGRWRQFDSPREVSQPEPLGRTHKGAARSQTHVLRAHITRSILRIIRSWISRLWRRSPPVTPVKWLSQQIQTSRTIHASQLLYLNERTALFLFNLCNSVFKQSQNTVINWAQVLEYFVTVSFEYTLWVEHQWHCREVHQRRQNRHVQRNEIIQRNFDEGFISPGLYWWWSKKKKATESHTSLSATQGLLQEFLVASEHQPRKQEGYRLKSVRSPSGQSVSPSSDHSWVSHLQGKGGNSTIIKKHLSNF